MRLALYSPFENYIWHFFQSIFESRIIKKENLKYNITRVSVHLDKDGQDKTRCDRCTALWQAQFDHINRLSLLKMAGRNSNIPHLISHRNLIHHWNKQLAIPNLSPIQIQVLDLVMNRKHQLAHNSDFRLRCAQWSLIIHMKIAIEKICLLCMFVSKTGL